MLWLVSFWSSVWHVHRLVFGLSRHLVPFVLLDLLLERVYEFAQSQVQLLAALKDSIRRRDLTVGLNFDFDVFDKWMSFLVDSEPHSWVLKKLISEAISQSVVLILDDNWALESLSRVIFVRDPIKKYGFGICRSILTLWHWQTHLPWFVG